MTGLLYTLQKLPTFSKISYVYLLHLYSIRFPRPQKKIFSFLFPSFSILLPSIAPILLTIPQLYLHLLQIPSKIPPFPPQNTQLHRPWENRLAYTRGVDTESIDLREHVAHQSSLASFRVYLCLNFIRTRSSLWPLGVSCRPSPDCQLSAKILIPLQVKLCVCNRFEENLLLGLMGGRSMLVLQVKRADSIMFYIYEEKNDMSTINLCNICWRLFLGAVVRAYAGNDM